jgi:hypothetical protein
MKQYCGVAEWKHCELFLISIIQPNDTPRRKIQLSCLTYMTVVFVMTVPRALIVDNVVAMVPNQRRRHNPSWAFPALYRYQHTSFDRSTVPCAVCGRASSCSNKDTLDLARYATPKHNESVTNYYYCHSFYRY